MNRDLTRAVDVESLWNGVEVDGQTFPAFRAWEEAADQLDQYLADAVLNPGVTALSLASQPATGKSTSLIRHIFQLSKASKAPSRVWYVVSTEVEARFIKSWLIAHGAVNTDAESLGVEVLTTERFRRIAEGDDWASDLTIVFDISWYPTVDDEVALGLLLGRAREVKKAVGEKGMKIHMAIVLLMSGVESPRTLKAFKKVLGHITQIDLLHRHHTYPELRRLDGDWEETLANRVESVREHGGRVVIADTKAWLWPRFSSLLNHMGEIQQSNDVILQPKEMVNVNIDTLLDDDILITAGETPYAVGLKGVSVVICSGLTRIMPMINPRLMQLVDINKGLTWPEILRVASWGVRSSEYARRNVVFCAPRQDWSQLQAMADHDRDDMGRAWNRDLPIFLLAIFSTWPGLSVGNIPIRSAPDGWVFVDGIRRLCMLGCIVEADSDGTVFQCTDLGSQILEIWKKTSKVLSFHVAFLLARVAIMQRDGDASPLVLRVLVHMAAIAHTGIGLFMDVSRPINERDLADCFPPIIPTERRHAGGYWAVLGLYLHCHEAFWETQNTRLSPVEGVTLSVNEGQDIKGSIEVFERLLTPASSIILTDDWYTKTLDEAEVTKIDEELMWAWLHRVVFFHPNPESQDSDIVTDSVTFETFGVGMAKELLDTASIRRLSDEDNHGQGAFFAIYESLDQPQEEVAGPSTGLVCSGMTWIPASTFEQVPVRCGLQFPDAVDRYIARPVHDEDE